MPIVVASHTMPSLDEMFGAPALCVALLFAALVATVAGSGGARSIGRLRWHRHLAAVAGGVVPAWTALLGLTALCGLNDAPLWLALAVGTLGTVVTSLAAWQAARRVARWLCWYQCETCGRPFRASVAAICCPSCHARRDEIAARTAVEEFADRYRQLGAGPAAE